MYIGQINALNDIGELGAPTIDRLTAINKSRQPAKPAGMRQTTDKHLANNRLINQRVERLNGSTS